MNRTKARWDISTVADVSRLEMGQSPDGQATNTEGKGIPLIGGAADYKDGQIKASRYTTQATKVCRKGDLILCIRATIGKVAVADKPYCLGRGVAGLRPSKVTPDFLRYFLNSQANAMDEAGTGTTFRQIDKKTLSSWSIPLPEPKEQDRIVAKLDSLFTRSKSAREELTRIPRLAERYREAILASAFRGELTANCRGKPSTKPKGSLATGLAATRSAYFRQAGIKEKPALSTSWTPNIDLPGTWEFVSVDQLTIRVQYGSSAKTSESLTEGVPVLRMGNIFEGQLDYTNLKYLPTSHDEFPELLLRDGDILFNRTNSAELVGKTAVYSDLGHPMSFASYLIRLRVVGYLPELLSAYINSAFGRAWVRSVVNQQVGQANVNGTKLRELGVPMMPMDEQKELWSRINRAFTIIEHLSKEATRATELLDRLDQATLGKAFRGDLMTEAENLKSGRSYVAR